MDIQTKYMGEVEIDTAKIIRFSQGIPGFVDELDFVLLDLPDNPVFQILQSIRSENIAFIVTNPYQIYSDYVFNLDDHLLESLQIKNKEEVVILSIVTLRNPFHTSTLNLKAPIIIHSSSKQGKQYILNHEEYLTKAPIVPENDALAKGDESCLY